jgi:signal transduction histidine kinase
VKKLAPQVARFAAVAALYVATARLGLQLGAVSRFATLVWPPTGIALAALLLFGRGLWPAVALGAFVVNLWTGASVPEAAGIALGNTLEAVLGAFALHRLGTHPALDRLRDVVALLAVTLVSTGVSAGFGLMSLFLGGAIAPGHAAETLRAWWLGDVMGDLVVAPVLLTWIGTRRGFLLLLRRPLRWIEGTAFGLAAGWLTFAIFGPLGPGSGTLLGTYLLFPILTWAGLRFGPRGAAATAFLVSAAAIWGTAAGHGPFVHQTLSESLLPLQAFMAVVAVTGLLLAATVLERDAAVEARENIAAVVSHDLRVPLTAIQVSAGGLLRTATDERTRRHVDLVERSAARMEALIGDLLDLAMIESGNLSVELNEIETDALVREAIELVRPLAAAKSQQIAAVESSAPPRLRGDRKRLLQVLANLIGNAVKFAPERGLIAVEAEAGEGQVRFSVRDNGPGFEPEALDHMFEPFWQAPGHGRAGAGSGRGVGLGLAIAKAGASGPSARKVRAPRSGSRCRRPRRPRPKAQEGLRDASDGLVPFGSLPGRLADCPSAGAVDAATATSTGPATNTSTGAGAAAAASGRRMADRRGPKGTAPLAALGAEPRSQGFGRLVDRAWRRSAHAKRGCHRPGGGTGGVGSGGRAGAPSAREAGERRDASLDRSRRRARVDRGRLRAALGHPIESRNTVGWPRHRGRHPRGRADRGDRPGAGRGHTAAHRAPARMRRRERLQLGPRRRQAASAMSASRRAGPGPPRRDRGATALPALPSGWRARCSG